MSNPYVIGDLHCQAAVFCYKADKTVDPLKTDLQTIAGRPPKIRGEIHNEKSRFLNALKEWNEQCDPRGAFLCIYAHSGEPGIAPIGGEEFRLHQDSKSLIVPWEELSDSLPKGVAYLWLLGCRTQEALKRWKASRNIVLSRLLATDAKSPWRPFVKFFAEEISLDPIVYNDEMIPLLIHKSPKLARQTQYFGPDLKQVNAMPDRQGSEAI